MMTAYGLRKIVWEESLIFFNMNWLMFCQRIYISVCRVTNLFPSLLRLESKAKVLLKPRQVRFRDTTLASFSYSLTHKLLRITPKGFRNRKDILLLERERGVGEFQCSGEGIWWEQDRYFLSFSRFSVEKTCKEAFPLSPSLPKFSFFVFPQPC